jgi:Zn-dependent M28 family amino/carboxypeptidase
VSTITAGSVAAHVGYLASDALLGRDTPSPGLEAAAAYLVARYRELGLEPAGDGATFLQRFPYGGAMVPNVLAMLPGRDPALRGEYVVLSAHMDHVGVGIPVAGDSIYNGADDNASGTTALLEVARVLAGLPPAERPRRTIVFAHVSGEEKGLLGSEFWVTRPTLPIAQVVANLNLDMVGGNEHPDTVAALGGEYSILGPLIREVNARHPELRLTTSGDLWPQEQLFFRSDQLNFMRRDIPALFLFNGLHECYHRPCDEPDFIDADKLARVARLVTYTAVEIGNRDRRPTWNVGALAEVRRMIQFGG